MSSTTPLRDAWNAYKDNLDTLNVIVGVDKLEKGDYVLLSTSVGQHYAGEVVKIGRKNIVVKMPYGGWAGQDFKCMQDIKFEKEQVDRFYKPIKVKA